MRWFIQSPAAKTFARFGNAILVVMVCLIAPFAVWLAVTPWPMPHVVYAYTFRDNGDRYNPLAHRDYLTCTYWGKWGSRTVRARHGKCPWIRFFTHSLGTHSRGIHSRGAYGLGTQNLGSLTDGVDVTTWRAR